MEMITSHSAHFRVLKFCENFTKPYAIDVFSKIHKHRNLKVDYQLICGTGETGFYGNIIICLKDEPDIIIYFKDSKDPKEFAHIIQRACMIDFYNFEGKLLTNNNWEERKRITKKDGKVVRIDDVYCRYTDYI